MAEPTRADREDRDAHLDLDLGLGLFGNPNAMPPAGGFRADDEGAAAEGDDEGAAAEGDDEGAAAEGDDDLTPWGAEYDEFAPCEPPPDAGGADAAAGGAGAGGDAAGPVDFGAPLRALIPALLADDARHRVPGVTGGLYSLRDLEGLPRGVPGCGVPVVCAGTPGLWGTAAGGPWSPEVRNRPVIDDAAFAEEFAVALTEVMRGVAAQLRGFDLRRHGMVVAGGFPAGVLAGRPETAGDVDIFLVGHPDDEARRAAITALYRHLLAAGHRGRDGDRPVPYVGVHRTRGCVTFYPNMRGGCTPIQVVLRAYSSVSEVLHGFDLGAAQVAFDGERVFLTALGVFAATRGVNILNLAVRRVSYEARLARYLSRGYALVVPDLDVGAFRERRAGLPFASGYPPPGAAGPGKCRCWCAATFGPPRWVSNRDSAIHQARLFGHDREAEAAAPPGAARDALAACEAELGALEAPSAPGDYSGAGAGYAGGKIPYGDFEAIALRNARILGAGGDWGAGGAGAPSQPAEGGVRDPGALVCIMRRTNDPNFDVTGFEADAEMVFPGFNSFIGILYCEPPPLMKLMVALGPALIGRFLALRRAPPDLLHRIWAARAALAHEALAAAGFGPAAFAPVADRTALSGDPRYATTPAEWLGPLFAGPAE
jgi:hypothetical protein